MATQSVCNESIHLDVNFIVLQVFGTVNKVDAATGRVHKK
jgi:hypothetical protein